MPTNSLKNSILSKEWNYNKNEDLNIDDYTIGSGKKVWWICEKGHEWKAQISQRCRQRTGCPVCVGNRKKTHIEFVNEINKLKPTIEILTEYINAKSRIKCKCKFCGNIWEVVANNLQQGQGCPNCAKIKRAQAQTISQKEFVKRVKDINPNIKVIGNYKTAHKRINVKCKICGHIWNPQAWNLIQGNGCPNCFSRSTSYIEKFICESFKHVIGKNKVKERDRKKIKKELDIYIPDYNFAIEPGSWFWHKNKFDNDLEKIRLCKEKGINLIVIYDNYKENENINNENIITYSIDLANYRNFNMLKELVLNLFKLNSIYTNLSDGEWEMVSYKAYFLSRRKNTKEFIKDLNRLNKKIIVLGEYTGYKNKVLVKCKKCSYEWKSAPGHLLKGKACPKCRGFYKTHEEFVKQVQTKLPNIVLLTRYINTKNRVDVNCNICGHIWDAKPGNLLSGFGCPICARRKQSLRQSKPVYQYTLDGVFIKKYNSRKEASKNTGVSMGGISNTCEGISKTSGGFIWSYEKKNNGLM